MAYREVEREAPPEIRVAPEPDAEQARRKRNRNIALTAGIAGIRAFASSRGPVEIFGRGGAAAGGASPSGPGRTG